MGYTLTVPKLELTALDFQTLIVLLGLQTNTQKHKVNIFTLIKNHFNLEKLTLPGDLDIFIYELILNLNLFLAIKIIT